jgi:hypothetical protein
VSIATLNINVQPRRMLSAREAATYCGLPVKRLAVDCAVAPVVMPNGKQLYDKSDLDGWIDRLKGGTIAADDDILGKLG